MRRTTILIFAVFLTASATTIAGSLYGQWWFFDMWLDNEAPPHVTGLTVEERAALRRAGIIEEPVTRTGNSQQGVLIPDVPYIALWLAEMAEETIEETLQGLTDSTEYPLMITFEWSSIATAELREETFYARDIKVLLGNRRFRKAYEDLRETDRLKAAELLSQNIRENLAVLRTMLQKEINTVSQGQHKEPTVRIGTMTDLSSARLKSHPDYPPTRTSRRYAVLSYITLASLLELQEVRPAVEEVIRFAREEYEFFNSIDETEASLFKFYALRESLYTPSLLITATLCDPAWNAEKHQHLEAKLVEREVLEYRAQGGGIEPQRSIFDGRRFFPHDESYIVHYYQGITDEEFNDFFGW